ncbi:UDP-N-acetylmuramate--L-alanine ligase [Selenomonadales bacterium OttesenSCG-928-I06]|nr:UDP-N-acetylmuramate--L-alanine ligase [Selenomonadales bacterium OttesenSCG-928-I06]
MLKDIKKIHFIGIGGSGMSALANIMINLDYVVSGSDINKTEITEQLRKQGCEIYSEHLKDNVKDVEIVVVSSAINDTNPEIIAAKEKNIPIIHRSEVLAYLMKSRKSIAVAGAHGKTTTTSMIALMMEKADLDPTIVIGGELADINGSSKLGKGPYLVAEADESDSSFLNLFFDICIITNIEDDHMDHYKSIANILKAFKEFIEILPQDGIAIVCLDDQYIPGLIKEVDRKCISYAIENEEADYIARNIKTTSSYTTYDVFFKEKNLGTIKINIPGKHNVLNSLAAVATGFELNLNIEKIQANLAIFKGAKRRFQTKYKTEDFWIVDDYAHHPTEITATLIGAKQTNPKRLICVFQPHRYSRTNHLYKEFGQSFRNADLLILTDIYSAGETPIEGVSTKLIIDEATKNSNQEIIYIKEKENIAAYLEKIIIPGDLIITMGAGDIFKIGEELKEKLAKITI